MENLSWPDCFNFFINLQDRLINTFCSCKLRISFSIIISYFLSLPKIKHVSILCSTSRICRKSPSTLQSAMWMHLVSRMEHHLSRLGELSGKHSCFHSYPLFGKKKSWAAVSLKSTCTKHSSWLLNLNPDTVSKAVEFWKLCFVVPVHSRLGGCNSVF